MCWNPVSNARPIFPRQLSHPQFSECLNHSAMTQWSKPQAPLTPSNWSALYRGRGSPVMSCTLLKANNGQQASGVGDKRFVRVERNAYHLRTAIIRHRLNDITHQQVMRFNQGSKFTNISKVHLNHPQCFGTLAQPSHFLSNTPVMTQRIFAGQVTKIWSTNLHCADVLSLVEVKRLCECPEEWIAELV